MLALTVLAPAVLRTSEIRAPPKDIKAGDAALKHQTTRLHKTQERMSVSETPITWEKAVEIVESNDLGRLYRDQATMDRYRGFKAQCLAQGLSIVQYIVKSRLRWVDDEGNIDLEPNTTHELFTDPADAKIISNDFPYKFASNVTHIVVWTKLQIPSDPASEIGDVSSRTRAVIDAYIKKTFVDGMSIPQSNIIWFRNFPSLQSVAELSHAHILIKDMAEEHLQTILGTAGEVLTSEDIAAATD